jgi:hypothetical protein
MLDGSQPDQRQQPVKPPSQFIADFIQKMKSYRVPEPFDAADSGAVPQDVASNLAGRI